MKKNILITVVVSILLIGLAQLVIYNWAHLIPIPFGSAMTKWIDSEVRIEVTYLVKGGRWRALLFPYNDYDEEVSTEIIRGGVIVDGKTIKLAENENVVVFNSKNEYIVINFNEDIFMTHNGKFMGIDRERLRKDPVWINEIRPFLFGANETRSDDIAY